MTASSFTRRFLLGILFGLFVSGVALAEEFYADKTIRLTVGSPPGGGFDFYARTIARHIGRHIPGNPSVIVVNMPGAGSLVAANYAYNVAKPDGLSMWMFNVNFVQLQALGDASIKFDSRKFGWIGSAARTTYTCAVMGFSGVRRFDELLKSGKKVILGGLASGTQSVVQPQLLNMFLGTSFSVVSGYKGTSLIQVAMQRRELDGSCWGWQSMKATASDMLNAEGDNRLIPIAMDRRMKDPEVRDVAVIPELIKDPINRSTYLAWSAPSQFFRSFVLPPGTPRERLNVLRRAFEATLEDPRFLADARKSKLDVDHTPGEEVETLVEQIVNMPPKAKEILEPLMMEGRTQR